uniref:FBA_2 domain-containing protein n=2 Tax=Caenorhabditis tropicalis TaxID=1561998 RepID=A0A1I7TI22_9PELO
MYFFEGTMQRYELDAIMDWRRQGTTQFISFIKSKLPADYTHPYAFQFTGAKYSDARWVCLKDLLPIRNVHTLNLGYNNFKWKDLNKIIKYWITRKKNMFNYLDIEYKDMNISELMKDITVLKGFRSNKEFYLIASNSTVKQRLMAVQLLEYPDEPRPKKQLNFSVRSANRPHKISGAEMLPTWTREYRIRAISKKTLSGGNKNYENELAAEGVRMIDGFMTVQEKL